MRMLNTLTMGLLFGLVGADVVSAQGSGGGGCNRSQSTGSSYNRNLSPLSSSYVGQAYMQQPYQQQAYIQQAYMQHAYVRQQQLAAMQAAAVEGERQNQAREAQRLANMRTAADARRSRDEKAWAQPANKMASLKTKKPSE